jgi:hypothetical protein
VVTDYEKAWIALQASIASKPQHGRDGLLREMAELAAEHRVPAGETAALLRFHGVEVGRAHGAATTRIHRDEPVPFVGGAPSPADAGSPATMTERGHDGHAAADGRGRRDAA